MVIKRFTVVAILAAVAAALVFTGMLSAAQKQKKTIKWSYDFTKASKEAKQAKKPMMVDFYTTWCGWCKKLDKDTYSDSKVIDEAGKFVCVKVDGDKNTKLATQYKINGYPTIVFFNSSGKEVHRVVGYQGPKDFLKSMQEALKKSK